LPEGLVVVLEKGCAQRNRHPCRGLFLVGGVEQLLLKGGEEIMGLSVRRRKTRERLLNLFDGRGSRGHEI